MKAHCPHIQSNDIMSVARAEQHVLTLAEEAEQGAKNLGGLFF